MEGELNPATDMKDNKRRFYKQTNNKRRTKENLHPLLDAGENIVTKEKGKAEELNAFFTLVFNTRNGYHEGSQFSQLVNRDWEQTRSPVIQEEVGSDLLDHLDTQKSLGVDGLHPKGDGSRAH